MSAALVALDAMPRRDPKTGTFAARGHIDAKTLRRGWASAEPRLKRSAALRASVNGDEPEQRRDAFRRSLISSLRASRK
jgi:hypothetical protein